MDLLHFDPAAFPLFAGMPYSETVLCPGDGVFIPRWTWHFILAVDGPSARARMKELEDDVSSGANFSESADPVSKSSAKSKKKGGGRSKDAAKQPEDEEEVPHCFSVSFWWGDRKEKRENNVAHGTNPHP